MILFEIYKDNMICAYYNCLNIFEYFMNMLFK